MFDNIQLWHIILAFSISLVLIIGYLALWHKARSFVENHSEKLHLLKELNSKYNFHFINHKFCYRKLYDNKGHYNKIDPSSLFAYQLRENIVYYQDVVNKIKYNSDYFAEYTNKVSEIQLREKVSASQDTKIPAFFLKFCESFIFKQHIQKPPLFASFTIQMRYTSPKGKVNLKKSQVFSLSDMEVSLNSVARSTLDRNTYRQLVMVERGMVSDSMRYDVLVRDRFRCVICGAEKSQGVILHVDHIIPVSKGGKSTKENLRTLCERCNIGKSSKNEEAYFDCQEPKKSSQNTESIICPWCGKQLVQRQGKFGAFWGCTGYPNCRYTKNDNR